MNIEVGDKHFPLWLLGDSNPTNWADRLDFPLDARHPARHSIWTPILDTIQQEVFLSHRARIDITPLYVRNAIQKADHKPQENMLAWKDEPELNIALSQDLANLHTLVITYKPKIICSFGAFAFEFARRAIEKPSDPHAYGYWSTKRLGQEFRWRIETFDPQKVNLIPLLHATIARGRFLESHRDFCAGESTNYFIFTGTKLGQLLVKHFDLFTFWME